MGLREMEKNYRICGRDLGATKGGNVRVNLAKGFAANCKP